MIKLALSDMDNTLVPLGARGISKRTNEAIHAVLDAGVLFGPATGRDFVELMRLFRTDEDCFMTGIFSNGKRVRARGEYVSLTLIPHEQLVRVAKALEPEKDMFLCCYPAKTNLLNPAYVIGAPSEEVVNHFEAMTKFVGGMVDEVPDVDFVAATVACPGPAERMARCKELVEAAVPELRIVSPIPEWFDIMPRDVSKAKGLDTLLEATGIGLEEVVVFGDAANDLEILRKVKYSVAVSNAIPEVAKTANYHIGSCADEGVADALFQIAEASKNGELPEFLRD